MNKHILNKNSHRNLWQWRNSTNTHTHTKAIKLILKIFLYVKFQMLIINNKHRIKKKEKPFMEDGGR